MEACGAEAVAAEVYDVKLAGAELPYLAVLIRAQESRIRRLEQFDRQKAVCIDEQRRRAERRAA